MREVEELIRKAESLIQEGKSREEIFQFLLPFFERDPETAGALAEGLAQISHEKGADVLQRMLEKTDQKPVRKRIKRSLYRLKSKGIFVETTARDGRPFILRPLPTDPPEAFGTGIDSLGQRLLVLAIPHPGRGLSVMHGVTRDTGGLINFLAKEMVRKEFRSFFENLQEKSPFPIVPMEASYVAFLLVESYRSSVQRRETPPQDYLLHKTEIERVKTEYPEPFIYSLRPRSEIDEGRLDRGGDLLKDEIFATWRIGEDEIRPYADALTEAQESKLFLNDSQREGRFQEVYLQAVAEVFPEEKRSLYKRRLEETAYVLHQLGREEEAKTSLSVAADLEKPFNPIRPNPFLFQLVIRSALALISETSEKRKKEPSLIVRP